MDKYYLITEEILEKYGIKQKDIYETVFDFLSYSDVNDAIECAGYNPKTDEELTRLRHVVWSKYPSSNLDEIIDFLKTRGEL